MKIFRLVRHEAVRDMLLAGWISRPALNGTHHGEWSVLMEWLCDCNHAKTLAEWTPEGRA